MVNNKRAKQTLALVSDWVGITGYRLQNQVVVILDKDRVICKLLKWKSSTKS